MGAGTRRAPDVDRPAQRLETVRQANEPRTARRIRAANAVVPNRQHQLAVSLGERDHDSRRLRVLRGVRKRLRGDVVRRDLGRLAQTLVERDIQLDRDRRAARNRPQNCAKASLREDCGMNAARELPQVDHGVG
jgi:hypothetical protein